MNISAAVASLNAADWDEAVIAEMSDGEITENIESLQWERMHYEKICAEFEPKSRQERYAQGQIDAIDTIVQRLGNALKPASAPAGHDWSPAYAPARP